MRILIFLLLVPVALSGQTNLWGLTVTGGSSNHGTLIQYSIADNSLAVNYEFNSSQPGLGSYPSEVGLTLGPGGKLFGVTTEGGQFDLGVIFEYDPQTYAYTTRFSFKRPGGCLPRGALTYAEGKFYGIAFQGGDFGYGTLYEWDPVNNTYQVRHHFDIKDGGSAHNTMTYMNGVLYGISTNGGELPFSGVIFEYTPSTQVFVKRLNFNLQTGSLPFGQMTYHEGKFYATTSMLYAASLTSGKLFEWDPITGQATEKKAGMFKVATSPFNGKIYGLGRLNPGEPNSFFEFDPSDDSFTFKATLGDDPIDSQIILYNNKFYGIVREGYIFEWDVLTNTVKKSPVFNGANGSQTSCFLTAAGGKLYGLMSGGGNFGAGTLFEFDPVTFQYAVRVHLTFSKDAGYFPLGALTLYNGKLYGTTAMGGDMSLNTGGVAAGIGTLFEYDPDSRLMTKKIDLTPPLGYHPRGTLTPYAGKLYGTVTGGGDSNVGSIIEWNLATNTVVRKFDFGISNGQYPGPELVVFNNKLYGMTNSGGANNKGVIFEYDPVTNNYLKKFDFGGIDGEGPVSYLTLFNNKFYGTTVYGGVDNAGVFFEWNPVTNVMTKRVDLKPADGYFPNGPLTVYNNKLYAMLRLDLNILVYQTALVEWDPTTTNYSRRYTFGKNFSPGGLIVFDGYLYAIGDSQLFKWKPDTNDFHKLKDLDFRTGYSQSAASRLLAVTVQDHQLNFDALPDHTFTDSDFILTATSDAGVPVQYTSSQPNLAEINGNKVTIKGTGVVTITARSGNWLYKSKEVTRTLTIKKANQVITLPVELIKGVDDAPFALTGSVNSNLPLNYTSSDETIATIIGSQVTIRGAGQVIITASQAGNENFLPASRSMTLLVKKNQKIIFAAIGDQTLGNPPVTIHAEAATAVAFQTTTPTKVMIDGILLSTHAAGKATIQATAATNENFFEAHAEQTICVNPPKPTILPSGSEHLVSSTPEGNQWYLNGQAINGATGLVLAIIEPGTYTVINTIEGCASEVSEPVTLLITDVKEVLNTAGIYPNPARSVMRIDLSRFAETVTILVTDRLNRVLMDAEKSGGEWVVLPVTELPGGLYFVRLSDGHQTQFMRFIKE
ncbi:MAG: T9SS type A sorting domain-containing protein [Cyclobacteriaceae bacterium]|nr:T9SS type A sorting domain-containing protein [Cyclobacteriaceae bacterium]